MFLAQPLKFPFWVSGGVLAIYSMCFGDFLEIKQLEHWPFGDNNLAPFHLWWKEIVLKR